MQYIAVKDIEISIKYRYWKWFNMTFPYHRYIKVGVNVDVTFARLQCDVNTPPTSAKPPRKLKIVSEIKTFQDIN